MKTKLFSIASLLIILSVFSSTRADAQIKFGPIVGANFSNITGDDVFDSDGMLIGFHIGALVNFGVTDYLMIEPQILYSTKGAKGKSTDLNFEYIEIPIWIRYQMESGINFNVGPYAGILTSAKTDDNNLKDNFKSTDFGLGAGIGYQTGGGLGLAVNYCFGLANIGEDVSILGQNYTPEVKNTCIKLSLSFTLGGRRGG